jgi:hypothetical protein
MKKQWAQEIDDAELSEALGNFKASVSAWSEAAGNRQRTISVTVRHAWRRAAVWACGCLIAAVSVGAAMHVFHTPSRQQAVYVAPPQQTGKQVVPQKVEADVHQAVAVARQDQDLMATVDSDVSRQVPAAMEPLAQLMNESGTEQ